MFIIALKELVTKIHNFQPGFLAAPATATNLENLPKNETNFFCTILT